MKHSEVPVSELDISQIDVELARCKVELVDASTSNDQQRLEIAKRRDADLKAAKTKHEYYQRVTLPQIIIDRNKAGFSAEDVFNSTKCPPSSVPAATSKRQQRKKKPAKLQTREPPKIRSKTTKEFIGLKATMQSKLKPYKITKSRASKPVSGFGSNKFFKKEDRA